MRSLLLLALSLGPAGCDSLALFDQRYDPVTIEGEVADAATGAPISGAAVVITRELVEGTFEERSVARDLLAELVTPSGGTFTVRDRISGLYDEVRYRVAVDYCPGDPSCPYQAEEMTFSHPQFGIEEGRACEADGRGGCVLRVPLLALRKE